MGEKPTDPRRKAAAPNLPAKPASGKAPAAKPIPVSSERVGETAVKLRWLTRDQLDEAINDQTASTLSRTSAMNLEEIFLRNKWLTIDQIAYLRTVVQEIPGAGSEGVPQIGRYEIRGLIGTGGMARVYRAWDPSLAREIALKVPNPGAIKRWEREARAVARLHHPNIIAVHDIGDEGGTPYMAMELIDGTELNRVWTTWPIRRRVEVLRDVAAAVHYAHENGVVHRDLKPENVMVTKDGLVKVLDFGLARVAGENSVTLSGSLLGSPVYMAPEQVRGEPATPSIDVYAMGVLLYELLTGHVPFNAANVNAVYERILRDDPMKPSHRKPQTPPDLETICLKALEKEVPNRYRTAQEFGADLDRWLSGLPITARAASMASRIGRRVRRNPWPLSMVSGMIIVIAGAGIILHLSGRRDNAAILARDAAIAYGSGDLSKARTLAESALATDPDHPEARYWMARVRLREFQARRGVPEVRIGHGLVTIIPPIPETPSQREDRRVIREAFKGNSSGKAFADAVLAMWDGKYEDAMTGFSSAAATSWEAKILEAQCLYYLLRFDDAEQKLRPQLGLDPRLVDLTWGRLMIARALQEHLRGREGSDLLTMADAAGSRLEQAGDVEAGRLLRARALIEAGNYEEKHGRDPRGKTDQALRLLEGNEGAESKIARGDSLAAIARHMRATGKLNVDAPVEILAAIEAYTKAVAARPDFGHAYALRAEIRRLQIEYCVEAGRPTDADIASAVDDFRQAVVCTPDYYDAQLGLAWAQGKLRRRDEVDFDRTKAAYEEEISAITDVLARVPDYAPAHWKRGATRFAFGTFKQGRGLDPEPDWKQAEADLERALKISPQYKEPILSLFALHQQSANYVSGKMRDPGPHYRRCRELLDMCLRINPRESGIFAALGGLLRIMAISPATADKDPMLHCDEAIEACNEAVRLMPTNASYYLSRAYIKRDFGQAVRDPQKQAEIYESAMQDLEAAIKLNPKMYDAYRVAGMVRQRMAHILSAANQDPMPMLQSGVEICEKAVAADPVYGATSAAVNAMLGALYSDMAGLAVNRSQDPTELFKRSLAFQDKAIKINPSDPTGLRLRAGAHHGLARYQAAHGVDPRAEYDAAIADSSKAIDLLGKHPHALSARLQRATAAFELAGHRESRGDDPLSANQQAIDDFTELINANPASSEYRLNRGTSYLNVACYQMRNQVDAAGNLNSASENFRETLKLDPQSFQGWVYLGRVQRFFGYIHQGKDEAESLKHFEESIAHYSKACEFHPKNQDAHLEKALSLMNLGRRDDAKVSLEKALEFNPALEDQARKILAGESR